MLLKVEQKEKKKRELISDIKSMRTLMQRNKDLIFYTMDEYYDFITFLNFMHELLGEDFDSDQVIKTIEETGYSFMGFYNKRVKGKNLTKDEIIELFKEN